MMETDDWERSGEGKSAQPEKAQGRRKGEWDLFSPVNST